MIFSGSFSDSFTLLYRETSASELTYNKLGFTSNLLWLIHHGGFFYIVFLFFC